MEHVKYDGETCSLVFSDGETQDACYEGHVYKFEMKQHSSIEIGYWFINARADPANSVTNSSIMAWLSHDETGELSNQPPPTDSDDSIVQSLVCKKILAVLVHE